MLGEEKAAASLVVSLITVAYVVETDRKDQVALYRSEAAPCS